MFLWPLHIWLLLPLSLNISLSLSRSLYLSLTHSLTHSLMLFFCTVSLQSLPSKKEAVGGSLSPPHMNQYKALLRKNISLVQPSIPIKQKRKKGRRKERKKGLSEREPGIPLIAKEQFHDKSSDLAETGSNDAGVFPWRKWKWHMWNLHLQCHVYMCWSL